MKFKNDKEKTIYYWKRAKECKNSGDNEGYAYYVRLATQAARNVESSKDRGDLNESR